VVVSEMGREDALSIMDSVLGGQRQVSE
jgi:hypothetical protein